MVSWFKKGFTLVETILVAVILAVAAMIAVPMVSSADSMQMRSAANVISADLEYAKSLAISRQKHYSVEFDASNESYRILDQNGQVISRPDKPDFDYQLDFKNESRLDKVDIESAVFGAYTTVTFDYLGCPYSGPGTSTPMTQGKIVLTINGMSTTIKIEPVTGYITVTH